MSENPFGASLRKVQRTESPSEPQAAPSAATSKAPASPLAPDLKEPIGASSPAASRASQPGTEKGALNLKEQVSSPLAKSGRSEPAVDSVASPLGRKESNASIHSRGSQAASVHLSRKGSQATAASAAGDLEEVVSVVSQGFARVPSQISHHSAAPSVGEVMRENEKLKAQIESLQRLLASGNQDAKIHRFQEEVHQKALRVKELEKLLKESQDDAKKWKTQAEAAKKDKKKKSHYKSETSEQVHHHDSELIGEKNVWNTITKIFKQNTTQERIKDLEKALAAAQSQIAQPGVPVEMVSRVTSHSDGPAPATQKAAPVASISDVRPYQNEIHALKQQVIEKDISLRSLDAKLTKAQEAILGSAGVGWENHVKLHQTKGMLTKIIQSSPKREERVGSASPQAASPTNDRLRSRPEMSPSPNNKATRMEFTAMEDHLGTLRLWRVQGESTAIVTSVQYTNGVLYDQTGSVLNVSDPGELAGDYSRLIALADQCRVPHTLPPPPLVLVAGHTVGASPRAGSMSGPLLTSQVRYRSPTRIPPYY